MADQFADDLHLDEQPFVELISHLLSNSNPTRTSAEEKLLYLSKNHPEFLCFKTSLLLCSPLDDTRFVAAILLRQFFTPTSDFYLWSRLSPFCQFYLRIILLLSLQEERIRYVANAKGDTIANLASHLVPLHPQYPELLPFVLVHMAKNEQQVLVEANLRIFSRIAIPLAVDDMMVPYIPHLRSILSTCITHSTLSLDVRVAALSASCSLVQFLPPKSRKEFPSLLNFFGYVLLEAIRKEPTAIPKVLQLLNDFARADPNFFCTVVHDLDAVMALAESDLVNDGARYLVLEFALTLAEAGKLVSGTACKMPLHVPQVFAILLKLLLYVCNNMARLGTQPEGHEPNQSGKYTVALEYLDRLVSALGGNEVLKAAVDMLPAYLRNTDWKIRHASVIALACIFERCSEDMNLEGQFHGTVLTALGGAMDDFKNPCIQVSAAKAVTNFIEKCNDGIILTPYLNIIVEKLIVLLKQGNQMVQERALSALTNVVKTVSDKFKNKYYDAAMPQLMHILRNATDKTDKMFLAKIVDCITIIDLSARKDKFGQHANEVMGVLISLQRSLNHDFPVMICGLEATKTTSQCLESDFLPHMDLLLKPLLESAELKPKTETPSACFVAKKVLVCNILLSYIKVLKEHFLPWTKEVTLALAPLIKSKCHVEVKKASARAMPQLLNSVKMATERGISHDHKLSVKLMFANMLPILLDGIRTEQDAETCGIILKSLSECLEMSAGVLKENQIRNIVGEMKCLIASIDAKEKVKTGDLIHIGACFSTLINNRRADFLPYFDELSKHIIPMPVSEGSVRSRRLTLMIFNDIADKCEHEAVRYYDDYLPHLLVACNDCDPYIRQEGVSGVGICAKFGGSCFEPFLSGALENINNIILSRNALAPSNAFIYDNAVATLGLICRFQKFSTRPKAIVTWLNCLPISYDLGKAEAAHELLCSLAECSDIFGENNKPFLKKIVSIFIEILNSGVILANKQTRNRMVKILKGLKDAMPLSFMSSFEAVLRRHFDESSLEAAEGGN